MVRNTKENCHFSNFSFVSTVCLIITTRLLFEVEKHILGQSIVWSIQILTGSFVQSFLRFANLVKVRHEFFCLARKNAQNQVFGNINYKETLMQNSLCTLFIYYKILILSIFRANLKNDQKNDINVQFSHPLQTVCTNQSGSKETLYFFFICRNQIFHYQLSF